jgi:hypothetical protein
VSIQQRLKAATRAARTKIVAAQLFSQFLVSVNDPVTALDAGF